MRCVPPDSCDRALRSAVRKGSPRDVDHRADETEVRRRADGRARRARTTRGRGRSMPATTCDAGRMAKRRSGWRSRCRDSVVQINGFRRTQAAAARRRPTRPNAPVSGRHPFRVTTKAGRLNELAGHVSGDCASFFARPTPALPFIEAVPSVNYELSLANRRRPSMIIPSKGQFPAPDGASMTRR